MNEQEKIAKRVKSYRLEWSHYKKKWGKELEEARREEEANR